MLAPLVMAVLAVGAPVAGRMHPPPRPTVGGVGFTCGYVVSVVATEYAPPSTAEPARQPESQVGARIVFIDDSVWPTRDEARTRARTIGLEGLHGTKGTWISGGFYVDACGSYFNPDRVKRIKVESTCVLDDSLDCSEP